MLRYAAATDDAATYPAFALGDTITFPADGKPGTVVGLPDDGAGGFVPLARVTWTAKASVGDLDANALAQRSAVPTVSGATTGTAVFPAIRIPASVTATFPASAGQPSGIVLDVQAELTDGTVRTLRAWAQVPVAQVTRAQIADVPADMTFQPSTLTLANVGDTGTVVVSVIDANSAAVGASHVVTVTSTNVLVAVADQASYVTTALGQITVHVTRTGTGLAGVVFACEQATATLGGATTTGRASLTVPAPSLAATGTGSAGGVGALTLTVPAPTLAATGTGGAGTPAELTDAASYYTDLVGYWTTQPDAAITGSNSAVTAVKDIRAAGTIHLDQVAGTLTRSATTKRVAVDSAESLKSTLQTALRTNAPFHFVLVGVFNPTNYFGGLLNGSDNLGHEWRNGSGVYRMVSNVFLDSTIAYDGAVHCLQFWGDGAGNGGIQVDGEAPVTSGATGTGMASAVVSIGNSSALGPSGATEELSLAFFRSGNATSTDRAHARTLAQTYHGAV